jgi:predicted HicB family RNase H-like nuclease
LIGHNCHGATEAAVLTQLQTIVEEWVEILLTEGTPLPTATANRKFSGKFLVRLPPEVHRRIALKAMARGDSLNQFVARTLNKA